MPELSELCRDSGRCLEFAFIGLGPNLTETLIVIIIHLNLT